MKRIWKIDVPGKYGYSFAVKGNIEDEDAAIETALKHGHFEEDYDADYASAEEITNSKYNLDAFKDVTYEIPE